MILGQFLPSRELVIDLLLLDDEQREVGLRVVVDTGFSGHLLLPLTSVQSLRLSQTDWEEASLADGSILRFPVYEVTVMWDGEERTVPAWAADSGALLGIGMLMGSIGTFEFFEGGTLTIEAA